MAAKTKIQWAESTWSPVRARHRGTGKLGWHCVHVSPGCINCYAEDMNEWRGTGLPFKPGYEKDVEIFLDETMLTQPLRWKKPRTIFVCSMTDLFADFVADEWIDQIFAVMALTPHHTYQVLTKRSVRMREYCTGLRQGERSIIAAAKNISSISGGSMAAAIVTRVEPPPNVWLGVSAEDQTRADERIPDLLATPAAVRFVSLEPLLGPIDLEHIPLGSDAGGRPVRLDALDGTKFFGDDGAYIPSTETGLSWAIIGGESGKSARVMRRAWADDLVRQCRSAGVAVFVKQLGAAYDDLPSGTAGAALKIGDKAIMLLRQRLKHPKGGDIEEFPDSLKLREMPR